MCLSSDSILISPSQIPTFQVHDSRCLMLESANVNAIIFARVLMTTEIHGPIQGFGRLRLRQRGLEGEDGELEAEAGKPAACQERGWQ
jgi:hypothetical protein